MILTFKSRFLIFALLGGFLLFPLGALHAMTVSPVRVELNGDPGKTVTGTFKVFNEEKEARTLYTAFENFEASGETGSPSFKPGTEGLASWISAPRAVDVPAGQSTEVNFSVAIPANAEAGGYFAAIFVANVPPSNNPNEVVIGSRVGTLLLFRVNGDIEEGGSLLEFGTKDKQTFFTALPISFYYRFQNSGADRVFPKSSLTIKNTIGRTTTVLDANPAEGNVLPGSIRRFEVWWRDKDDSKSLTQGVPADLSFFETVSYQWNNFAFGRYSANLEIAYGTKGETVSKSMSLFVLPWQLLLVELLVLALVIFIGRFIIKRYNTWIVKRARS